MYAMIPAILYGEEVALLWLVYGALAIAGFLICRWRTWTFVILMPIVTIAAWAGLTQLWIRQGILGLRGYGEESVWRGFIRLAGPNVAENASRHAALLSFQWRLAILLAVAAPIAGILVGRVRHRTPPLPETAGSQREQGAGQNQSQEQPRPRLGDRGVVAREPMGRKPSRYA